MGGVWEMPASLEYLGQVVGRVPAPPSSPETRCALPPCRCFPAGHVCVSAYLSLHTCLCIQAAFSARLIGTVTEEWLRVIRKQALCKMKITLQEVKELVQGQVACKCRAGVGTGIF